MAGFLSSWLPAVGAAPSSDGDDLPPAPPPPLPFAGPVVRVVPIVHSYRAELVLTEAGPICLPAPPTLAPHGTIVTELAIDWFECHTTSPGVMLRLRLHHAAACSTWANNDPQPLTCTFPTAPYSGSLGQCVFRHDLATVSQQTLRNIAISSVTGVAHRLAQADIDAVRQPFLFARSITGDVIAPPDAKFNARITFNVRATTFSVQPVR